MNGTDLAELDWMSVAKRLETDTRIVIPMGATEEHGYLSLCADTIFAEHVSRNACQAVGVLRAPPIPFGCSAFSVNFPGSVSLRTVTICHLIEDIIDCFYRQGFRRLVFATGHGGNEVITGILAEQQIDRPQLNVYYYNLWAGMNDAVRALEAERDLGRSEHASWTEVQPDTVVTAIPEARKEPPGGPDYPLFPLNPRTARHFLGDGVVAGTYNLRDEKLLDDLREQCVDHFAGFLRTLPPTPSDVEGDRS